MNLSDWAGVHEWYVTIDRCLKVDVGSFDGKDEFSRSQSRCLSAESLLISWLW